MNEDYVVDIRVTMATKYHIPAPTPALARQYAIDRAMEQFRVPRSHVEAEVLGVCSPEHRLDSAD